MYSAAMLPYLVVQWLRQAAIDARRRDRTARYLLWSVLAGAAGGAMVGLAAMSVFVLWWLGLWWLALPMAGVLFVPVLAGPMIRLALVPAGWHRLAYHAAAYSRPGTDPPAYALCVAAWAARDGEAIAWVEAKRDARTPLGDGEIAATALLAAGRGDAATARELLRSLTMIVEDHAAVRELAGEWLACDTAERGAWNELVQHAARARWPVTPLGFLLEGIAARHVGAAGAPSARELWGRWLLAPHRRATRGLVREAIAVVLPASDDGGTGAGATSSAGANGAGATSSAGANGAGATSSAGANGANGAAGAAAADAAEATVPDPTTLPRAVAAHLAFDAAPPTAASLATAVRAWDAALADAATRSWLARRAIELDAPHGAVDRAIRDVAGAVTDDLARIAETAKLGAPPGASGAVGGGLTRRLRHGRLDALEAAFSRWAERRHDNAPHPAIDEWREFLALWTAYSGAVAAGGIELRRLAFPHAFAKGSNMAAWLWNKREEYALSHAISAWLLAEALAVGDTEAIELGHRNCALSVPTRLGRVTS